jgi:hypothetical protein
MHCLFEVSPSTGKLPTSNIKANPIEYGTQAGISQPSLDVVGRSNANAPVASTTYLV